MLCCSGLLTGLAEHDVALRNGNIIAVAVTETALRSLTCW